jgi:REP element-mobilizing transposase RayT
MMTRLQRKKSKSGIYHVLLRGINRQRVFEDDEDYRRFILILDQIRQVSDSRLLAYCLMSNHVHLLIEEQAEQLGETIKRLAVRYVMWFNAKYERVGHLFQDRFQSEPVESDEYFVTVLRYIFQNPVKACLSKKPEDYPWSSSSIGKPDDIIDFNRLRELCEIEAVLAEENQTEAEAVLDMSLTGRRGRSDAQASKRLYEIGGVGTTTAFLALDKTSQKVAVLRLLDEGFSLRQVARVCGLSKGLIESWRRTASKARPD